MPTDAPEKFSSRLVLPSRPADKKLLRLTRFPAAGGREEEREKLRERGKGSQKTGEA
jgi:hypothetical protein